MPTATGELTLTTPPQQTSEQVTTLQQQEQPSASEESDAEISKCVLFLPFFYISFVRSKKLSALFVLDAFHYLRFLQI